jgi:general secretion pathway protein D
MMPLSWKLETGNPKLETGKSKIETRNSKFVTCHCAEAASPRASSFEFRILNLEFRMGIDCLLRTAYCLLRNLRRAARFAGVCLLLTAYCLLGMAICGTLGAQAPIQSPASQQTPAPQKPAPTGAQKPGGPPALQVPPQVPAQPQKAAVEVQQGPPAASPGIGFRLENADLLQFISLIMGQLKLNYVVDPTVRGAATISTAGELRTEDLLPILESVLKMSGATAIKTGNFYRIVPLVQAPRSPLQVLSDPTGQSLPKDDQMVMEIIPMRFVFAADMAKMLTPFLSEGGSVAVHEAANVLIMVDNSLNVKRLIEILQQFDNSAFAKQRVRLIPVHNNIASGLIPELESIFSAYALSAKNTPLRFVPLDRINALLVAAADPSAFDEIEKWVEKLDQPAAPSGLQTFVYKVQNSEAGYLVRLLSTMRGRQREGEPTGTGGPPTRGASDTGELEQVPAQPAQPAQRATQRVAGTTETAGGRGQGAQTGYEAVMEGGASIVADPRSNSIIINSTAQDYAEIVKTLNQLDVLPRQVFIEARVYEVTLTGDLEFGVEYHLQQNSGKYRDLLGSITSTGLALQAGVAVGATRELFTFLTASQNRSRVRVLSAPTVLATDSSPARIQVGSSVPVLTSQGITAGAIAGSSSLFTNTINNVDTGVILSITPRITSTGLVNLVIDQEISSAIPAPVGAGIQSPSFSKRSVVTHAVAQDGQMIALGGLMQYNVTTTTNRVPLLGDIPLLGALFGSTSYVTSKTELIVLLTPRIISTLSGALDASRELREKLPELRREFRKDEMVNPPPPEKPAPARSGS